MNRMDGVTEIGRMSGNLEGNDDDMLLVGHRNMFAFPEDIKAGALEGSHDPFIERPVAASSYADFDGA